MKRDKALLPFGHFSTMAEYQYDRLSKIFRKVYISAKSNKFDFDCHLIEDRYETSSPLVAIASIFETLEVDELFILSVDAPFVCSSTIIRLYEESKNSKVDAIVAKSKNGLEPLCAIYRKSSLSLAQEFISKDKHRLHSFLEGLNYLVVEFEESRDFTNLNYPHDYEKASLIDSL